MKYHANLETAMNEQNVKTAKEVDIIMPDLKVIGINSVKVKVRRIRVKQVFAIVRLLKKITEDAQKDSPNIVDMFKSGEALVSQMIFSLGDAEQEFYDLMTTLILTSEDKSKETFKYINEGEMEITEITEFVLAVYEQEKEVFGELVKKVQNLVKETTKKK